MGFGTSGWGGTISSGGGGGGGGAAPTVTNFLPPAGAQIQRLTPLAFDVLPGGTALANVTIDVLYPETGARENIYDGTAFSPNFIQSSGRTPIAGSPPGQHFVVSRRGGWPLAPELHGTANDVGGNTTRF